MTKLTYQQKLDALSYRFYQGGQWTPKAGDFYTTSRADLELYQVVSVEGGVVRTRFTEGTDAISEWPEDGFLTEGFGPRRVFVPDWVICAPPSPQTNVDRPWGDDWTVSDTDTAREILNYLGIGDDASKEPGADRRRDRVAQIIRKRIDASQPPQEQMKASVEAAEGVASSRVAKHGCVGPSVISDQNDAAPGRSDLISPSPSKDCRADDPDNDDGFCDIHGSAPLYPGQSIAGWVVNRKQGDGIFMSADEYDEASAAAEADIHDRGYFAVVRVTTEGRP